MANLTPPELYKLDLRMKGNRYRNVGLDDQVDLGEPGIEMFTYIKVGCLFHFQKFPILLTPAS